VPVALQFRKSDRLAVLLGHRDEPPGEPTANAVQMERFRLRPPASACAVPWHPTTARNPPSSWCGLTEYRAHSMQQSLTPLFCGKDAPFTARRRSLFWKSNVGQEPRVSSQPRSPRPTS
jgi:hypothetical protein